jgi:hypothetical protein
VRLKLPNSLELGNQQSVICATIASVTWKPAQDSNMQPSLPLHAGELEEELEENEKRIKELA